MILKINGKPALLPHRLLAFKHHPLQIRQLPGLRPAPDLRPLKGKEHMAELEQHAENAVLSYPVLQLLRGGPRHDEIAQGRVWTGADALKIGLVDEIGTLEDAIAYAASMGGDPDVAS